MTRNDPGMSTGTGTGVNADGDSPRQVKANIRRDSRIRSLAVLVLLLISFTAVNLYWTSHIAKSEQQKWCGLLVTLDNADRNAPTPKTAFGRALVTDFRDLREGFGCG